MSVVSENTEDCPKCSAVKAVGFECVWCESTGQLSNRDRRLKNDMLRLSVVRKSLRSVAECLSDLEAEDAARYLPTLIEELKMLKDGDTSSMAWGQVARGLDGPRAYGLDRIGLFPDMETKQ
jgi:hypothetical protein